MTEASAPRRPLKIALVAGEPSGDVLGASLLAELRRRLPGTGDLNVTGVGGPAMSAAGLQSLFPQSDIAVMGVGPVLRALPRLLRRIAQTARHIVAERPDVLVTIDSPDFSLRAARKVRALAPGIPIVHWVCPSVWAWRPGRARRMRPHVDRILCILPFEPAELVQLDGPEGVYVGHPLIERLGDLRPSTPEEQAARARSEAATVLVLPGSRRSEVARLMAVFGAAAAQLAAARPGLRFVLPAVDHVRPLIEDALRSWTTPVDVVAGEAAKHAAFRSARAALAASGTVTLELALAGVPTVAAYRVAGWEAFIARRLIRVHSVLLPNLVLGARCVPEFLQEEATADALAAAMLALLDDGPARAAQLEGFGRVAELMTLGKGTPSEAAADRVLEMIGGQATRTRA